MRMIILFFGILLTATAQAELYKWVDENGEVVYSDEPPHESAEPLDPPPINTTPPPKVAPKSFSSQKPATPAPAEQKKPVTSYKEFKITSPGNDEAVRNNAGNVSISFALNPALDQAAGHTINLRVDGEVVQKDIKGSSVTIPHMDRGTHKLSAEIRDAQGKLLRTSNTVEFHLLRYSRLHNKPAP